MFDGQDKGRNMYIDRSNIVTYTVNSEYNENGGKLR